MAREGSAAVGEKPRLRGVSHQVAFFCFAFANVWLLARVRGETAQGAVLIYALSLAFLYGVSSLYHRRNWGETGRARMRRLDHSAIFVLIAGSYSPLFILLGTPAMGAAPLQLMWSLAAFGVLKSLLWSHGPKWVTALLAIAMGWSAIAYALELRDAMGGPSLALLLASGIVYTLGALVYALKRPDPAPRVFGYHEVFHLCVIAGSLTHYAHTILVLSSVGALPA